MNTLANRNLGSTIGMNLKIMYWNCKPVCVCVHVAASDDEVATSTPPLMAQCVSEDDIEVTIVLDFILYELMIMMFQVICGTIFVGDNINTE